MSHDVDQPEEGGAEADQTAKPRLTAGDEDGIGKSETHEADFEESLLDTDDRILETLLEAEAEPDADINAPPTGGNFDPQAEAEEVDELMKKFQNLSKKGPGLDGYDPVDDSEGEQMSRDVERILAEALGNLKVDDTLGRIADSKEKAYPDGDVSGSKAAGDNPAWSLPSVPSELPISPSASQPTSKAAALQSTGNFEQDMERRMAALLAGSLASPTDSSLSLPSVPTDKPSSFHAKTRRKGGPSGRVGFTDEDMETWCVACTDEGTLICPGCDDDVFCSQCWYDMHKGPMAGYDEGLHKPMQFNRERKENKVATEAS
jgi:hypothetical protein